MSNSIHTKAASLLALTAAGIFMSSHAGGAVRVATNGTVIVPANAVISSRAGGKSPQLRCDFGLPANAPARRWLEEELPIFQTSWEKDGIRYTQKVLVTSLTKNASPPIDPAATDAVVLVQITGHNTAGEYTTARATFVVESEGRSLNLELRNGLVYVTGTPGPAPLAAVDIPGEGIAATNGAQLRFQGNMPPGTSGSMTIKIPAARLEQPDAINRLQDLEFEEEFQRVKRAWKNRDQTAPTTWPVKWAEPGK